MSTPIETLRDAVQDYVRAVHDPNLVVTAFALGVASIDMHTADSEDHIATAAHGGIHSTLGLAHILTRDLITGDDD